MNSTYRSLTVQRLARSPNDAASRRGVIAMILVLVLTLLITTYATTIMRRGSLERNRDWNRQSITILESAIRSLVRSDRPDLRQVRLPLDSDSKRSVVVDRTETMDGDEAFQATLYAGEDVVMSIRRVQRPDKKPNPSESQDSRLR